MPLARATLLAALIVLEAFLLRGARINAMPPIVAAASPSPVGSPPAASSPGPAHIPDFATLQRQAAGARSLPFVRAVPNDVQTKDQVRAYLIKEMDADTDWAKEQLVVRYFGFVPRDFKLRPFLIDFYTEQVAGYYDYKTQMFHMVSGGPVIADPQAEDMAIVHEMDHALQDQHFGLKRIEGGLQQRKRDGDDYGLAVSSLLEGDACVVMLDWMFDRLNMDRAQRPPMSTVMGMLSGNLGLMAGESQPVFAHAPHYFQQMALFPYVHGAQFVDEVRRAGGWGAVNRIYTHLPRSSHEVLHPAQYLHARQALPALRFSADLAAPWRIGAENVFGEERMRLLWDQFAGLIPGRENWSDGWSGDLFRIYEAPPDSAKPGTANHAQTKSDEDPMASCFLVWYTSWADAASAREFCEGMRQVVTARDGVSLVGAPQEHRAQAAASKLSLKGEKDKLSWIIEQRGGKVIVLAGVPTTLLEQARRLAWSVRPADRT
jgi:hypothetical protein